MIARLAKARTVATAAILSNSGWGSTSTVRSFMASSSPRRAAYPPLSVRTSARTRPRGEYITRLARHASLTAPGGQAYIGLIRYTEVVMTKTEHLQFVVLMIPTILILVAAAVSMADLEIPADPTYAMASAYLAADE